MRRAKFAATMSGSVEVPGFGRTSMSRVSGDVAPAMQPRAFAKALSDAGWSLLLVDLDDEELDLLTHELTRRGERGWRGGIW